jgi:hypothetical protein
VYIEWRDMNRKVYIEWRDMKKASRELPRMKIITTPPTEWARVCENINQPFLQD